MRLGKLTGNVTGQTGNLANASQGGKPPKIQFGKLILKPEGSEFTTRGIHLSLLKKQGIILELASLYPIGLYLAGTPTDPLLVVVDVPRSLDTLLLQEPSSGGVPPLVYVLIHRGETLTIGRNTQMGLHIATGSPDSSYVSRHHLDLSFPKESDPNSSTVRLIDYSLRGTKPFSLKKSYQRYDLYRNVLPFTIDLAKLPSPVQQEGEPP